MSIVKQKEIKSNSKSYSKLILMMGLTILTQVIMLIKTSITASKFGISVEMDAFNFSNSIGTFIYSFIGAGVTTVLIPNLVNKDKEESINIFISVLYSVAFIILLVVHFTRSFIVQTFSGSQDEYFINVATNVMFITLITQYINSFTGATNAIFQCSGKFNLPKFITLLTSIILVILVVITSDLNIYQYSFYIFITTLLNVTFQLYLIKRSKYKFKFKLDLKNHDFRSMLKVFLPTVLSTGLYQFSLLTDSMIATRLGEGEISKLTYSNTIMSLINTVILSNIMIYFYPKISIYGANGRGQKKLFNLGLLINAIMIFLVVVFTTVGKEAISVLYERGNFTSNTTYYVFIGSLIYIVGLPSNAYRDLIYRYFYANGDTLTPFKNSLVVSLLNIIISIILSQYIGVYGIILGTVLTSYLSLFMILIRFKKKFKVENNKNFLLSENIKLIFIAILTLVICLILKSILPLMNKYMLIIIFSCITLLIYCLFIIIFKSKVLKVNLT